MPGRITVIGAGVIGLTSALRLLAAGHRVSVVSDRPSAETTSAIAAALWYPYLAFPPERVAVWSARTYEVLRGLAVDEPAAGVRLVAGRELLGEHRPDPDWAGTVPDLRRLGAAERAGRPDGWGFTAPVVDMPHHLAWLEMRVIAAGGQLDRRHVTDLEAERGADVLVNCTGLGARDLVGDATVRPVRGQVVLLTNPGLDEWVLDEDTGTGMTYVVPRTDTVVCGGTAEDDVDHLAPDAAVADRILRDARALVPALAGAEVVAHRIGLRPARPTVRLEREEFAHTPVVHCYGHGGAGVTLSWGCADEVVRLVG